ncbi:FAD-binding oxidoreductase [Hoeflea sp. WL0058]|uniref:FAD-binding oxidoreductase n=1 Tax=Flavimaribacter sediminis TaxID=2865987 RepID=A0AAE2ZJR1_9HYPH|nr:FAD-binding oxidoreductase [Flavimaribacter sediminis]MBW8635860.1 FAD-binding oxidoreductase [Flavimaribacter sediminis]
MSEKRVLVIGAGITGVSIAEWLRRTGWTVSLVDPVLPGSAEQTSYGNAGLLSRNSIMPAATPTLVKKGLSMALDSGSPLFLRWSYLPRLLPWLIPFLSNANEDRIRVIAEGLAPLVFDTAEQHQSLAKDTVAEKYISHGEYIKLFPNRAGHDADVFSAEMRKQYGHVFEELTREDIVSRDPNVGPAYTFATVFKDYCWIASPGGYVAALFEHFREHGGQFEQRRVVSVAAGDRPSVSLEGGDVLHADKIILSTGAWSGKLVRTSGIRVKLEAERGYHISIRDPAFTAPQPYMISDAKFIMTPMNGALRAAGMVEFAGLDAPATEAPIALLKKGVRKVYPGLPLDIVEPWMGRRPTTPDSLPVIGESRSTPNVVHAYGGQHIGLTIGPKVGRLISSLLAGKQPNMDMAPYLPDRF